MAGAGGDLLVALEVVPMYSTSSTSPPPSADAAVVVDGCDGYAVVPTAYSTWFRANTISSDAKRSGAGCHGQWQISTGRCTCTSGADNNFNALKVKNL